MAQAPPGLIGAKVGMTRLFRKDGAVVPVTVVKAGPCFVTQIKTRERDGYTALQLGFQPRKESRTTKPMQGHFKKSGGRNFDAVREFRTTDVDGVELGQEITVKIFSKGEKVTVIGKGKGKGFQGVIRRHGHHGGKDSHGSMFHRAPGSAGSGTYPGRVVKGRKFPGHMGDRRVTKTGLEVVDVNEAEHLLAIKGGLPGAARGWLLIRKTQGKG